MSETTKNFVLRKTTPNDLMFNISPLSNQVVKRLVHLTDKMPFIALPLDWALDIFFDPTLMGLYQEGAFTFNDNEGLLQEAIKAGVYFGTLDFEPSSEQDVDDILKTLQAGRRSDILAAVKEYGKEKVLGVVTKNIGNLTQSVIQCVEETFGVQLSLNQD